MEQSKPDITQTRQILNDEGNIVRGWRLTISGYGHEATFVCMMPDFQYAASYARARFMRTIDASVSQVTTSQLAPDGT